MPVWFLALVVVAGGCNKLFDLEPVDPSRPHDGGTADGTGTGDGVAADQSQPTCNPSGFDEDSDGIDDACDGCPTISSTSDDDDGDGLPNACDSSLTTAEEIKGYWSFSGSTSSSSVAYTNAVIDTNGKGALVMAAGSTVTTNSTFLPTRIEAFFRGASATATSGKVSVSLPQIVACEVVAQTCSGLSGATCGTVVPSPNGGAMLGTPISSLRKVLFHEAGTVRCSISNASATTTAIGASLFASSQIQIATNGELAIFVDSLVIYGLK